MLPSRVSGSRLVADWTYFTYVYYFFHPWFLGNLTRKKSGADYSGGEIGKEKEQYDKVIFLCVYLFICMLIHFGMCK